MGRMSKKHVKHYEQMIEDLDEIIENQAAALAKATEEAGE